VKGMVKVKNVKYAVIGVLVIVGFTLGVMYFYFGGQIVAPPEEPEAHGTLGYNATCVIETPSGADITLLSEVRLWETYNRSDPVAWTWINTSGSLAATEFWHPDGWLNADLFEWNLTGYDAANRSVEYYLEARAWHQLEEWMTGVYTPPSWWNGSQIDMVEEAGSVRAIIEEGETAITWQRIYSGDNLIRMVAEPYTNYLSVIHKDTLQTWQQLDGYYPDGYTGNFRLRIKNPVNESSRGYNQEYDWNSRSWSGCWLIASSDDAANIQNAYQDAYGNDLLKWFNITNGLLYRGVIFNESLTTVAKYDCAMLLPSFSYDIDFYADIQIANGSAGISFFLGRGTESEIQILTQLL